MKSKILILIFGITLVACNQQPKQAQLAQLKDEREALDARIKKMEAEIQIVMKDSVNPDKFKFIGVQEIVETPFDHYIRVQGKLDGDQNAAVFAEAPGSISARFADVGQKVTKGQVLARIDDEQYSKQLESLETQYQFALEMFNKQKKLWDQKIGSEVQYLQAKTSKESLEQQIESVKNQIEKFKIKSPITGTIAECNIKIGSVVSPDPRLVVYRVLAFSDLKISAEVSEAYSDRVQEGDKLKVIFPDVKKEMEARIDFVSQYINPVNRTFNVETAIKANIPNLKANMVAILQINDYHVNNAMVVPMNVIQNDNNGSYVFVVRPKGNYHGAFKQLVSVGMSYNGLAEIQSGLKPGDKIVSVGFQELTDGEYIRF